MTLPFCAYCGHALDLHGDRAVCACSGITSGYGPGPSFRILPCHCPGYGASAVAPG